MGNRSTVRRVLVLIFALALFAVVPGALAINGDLIEKGSFETPIPAGSWDVFTNTELQAGGTGWNVAWTNPDEACGGGAEPVLEIQKSGTVVDAYDGSQYAELDTDCQHVPAADHETNVKIWQDVPTVEGFDYGLRFAWAARTPSDVLELQVPGRTETYDLGVPEPLGIETWDHETVFFTAGAGATSTVSFTEIGDPADSLGMFLDAVSCELCVSETSSELVYGRKNVDVGDVVVNHDDTNIYVTFTTVPGWVIHLTHVDVVDDPADFLQNNGGLIPGQFDYGDGPHVPGVTSTTITIPIADLDFIPGAGIYYIATHAELFELNTAGPFWASTVVDSLIGDVWPSTSASWWLGHRDDPDEARLLDGVFFSPGFGGGIEVEFDGWVYNGDGYDISVHEVTNGRAAYPEETAEVSGWYDDEWHVLGSVSNKDVNGFGKVDLGTLPYVEKVKIVDTTPTSNFDGSVPGTTAYANADGFDIDAIDAVNLILSEETGWGEGDKGDWKNWSMYFPFDFNICE